MASKTEGKAKVIAYARLLQKVNFLQQRIVFSSAMKNFD